MNYFNQINSKYAKAVKKDGVTFHMYVDFHGDATVLYAPNEGDAIYPGEIVEGNLPSEVLIFDGKVAACKKWLMDGVKDAHALAKAALKRLEADDGYSLQMYIGSFNLSGDDTSVEDYYQSKGLELL